MEFLKSLLNIPKTTNFSDKYNPNNEVIINESHLSIIHTQIKNLENINLSPLPTTSMDKNMMHNNMTNYLRKIIYSLYIILQDKLKSSQDEVPYFWKYVVKHFNNFNSVKYINITFTNEKYKPQEKSLAWLTILVLEKKLYDFISSLYSSGLDK